ncbi:hypothetical protein [Shewanella sp. MEBiC00475]|uniref:hypothetical protein n=1 Tax=Shewanella sp. MEBiC00475 TaxID=2575361 RepID=UPI0010C0DED3|nr:hypothetical protein [Shewanella sp. MEBiC00475]
MKLLKLLALFSIYSLSVSAKPINSFDGFDWGSSRNQIIEVRGRPDVLFGTFMSYGDIEDTVAGYEIDSLNYTFKEGCTELKETLTKPCELWKGQYTLEVKSQESFDQITQLLGSNYGTYSAKKKDSNQVDYNTKELQAIVTWTTHVFKQEDGSSIEVAKREFDRDFYDNSSSQNFKKGIQNLNVSYASAEYNQVQERKEKKTKNGF